MKTKAEMEWDKKTMPELARELYNARLAEQLATSFRIEVEEAIAARVETGDNGSKTVDAGDGLKVVVKRAMKYEANVDAIRDLGELDMPEGCCLPVKYVEPVAATYAFDEKAYEALRELAPAAFAKIAKFVTATPRKIAVSLKL